MRINTGNIIRKFFPNAIWEMNDKEALFITFDDGPTPGVTEWILNTLDRYDAKATFFVLGKNVELYPDLYQMILDRGHKVGNHTYSHQKGWGMSLERYIEDVDLAAGMVHSELFRPPYAQITRSQLRVMAQRFRVVMWTILTRDYNRHISPKKCMRASVKSLRGGDIIAFHDSAKSFRNMSHALPLVLRTARDRGLKCKIIEL